MTRGLGSLLAVAVFLATASASAAAQSCPEPGANFPPLYHDAERFEDAIAAEQGYPPVGERLTGITVPHHLVAGNLIARGVRAASGFDYDRIVVLTPDHFRRAGAPFVTTRHGFDTVLGPVETDAAMADALIAAGAEESCLFGREHGLRAVLPFLSHGFPATPILPVAISVKATRADWDRLADALAPLVDERVLVVQSTDFSHYHPLEVARQFDQRTLNTIASGSLDGIASLTQPDHLDSAGAMYVQTRLQRQVHAAAPVVLASENQQALSATRLPETTGYLLVAYGPFAGRSTAGIAGGELAYLAGDTFLGRSMARALADPDAAERVEAAVLALTGGNPLVANLEGVLLPNVPEALPHMTLGMQADLATTWLKRLNVVAAGLTNNHAMDLGPAGLAETTGALDRAGIAWFGQGDSARVGRLTIVGLTDIESNGPPYVDLIDDTLLDRLIEPDAGRPVVAFVHWGREYVATPSPREQSLAEQMRLRGVSVIAGAHPHVASEGLVASAGGETVTLHSLGNFLFDQSAPKASGSLLELRTFGQGTVFVRQVALPNLFDLARP